MPLFVSNRDAGFLLGVNRELLHGIISTEVAVYKLDLSQTDVNIYEESEQKAYKPPVRMFALIQKDSKSQTGDDFGLNVDRTLTVGFIKNDLQTAGLYIEEGDVIEYDQDYYQIDLVSDTFWSGKNPETSFGTIYDNWVSHGYDIGITAQCHLTKMSSLHVVDVRVGEPISPVKVDNSIPRFL